MNKTEGGLRSPEHMAGWTPSLHLKEACDLLEAFTRLYEAGEVETYASPVDLTMAALHAQIANTKMLGLVRRP